MKSLAGQKVMVKMTRIVEKNVDKNVTQCAVCDFLNSRCHYGCAFENDMDKKKCIAMDEETSICKKCGC